MAQELKTYKEFWPHYLSVHMNPLSRAMHYFGSGLAVLFLAKAIVEMDWVFVVPGVIAAFGFNWFADLAIERLRPPPSFRAPLWSLASDYRMLGLFSVGMLEDEYRRLGLIAPKEPPKPELRRAAAAATGLTRPRAARPTGTRPGSGRPAPKGSSGRRP